MFPHLSGADAIDSCLQEVLAMRRALQARKHMVDNIPAEVAAIVQQCLAPVADQVRSFVAHQIDADRYFMAQLSAIAAALQAAPSPSGDLLANVINRLGRKVDELSEILKQLRPR
ncbi:hypothetical protein D3874_21750 [Oleomonas cavernae]|uniref:Uncharacterized protein n=2 Tax=Oleomonas cavernae TaxID=2320859 RepID=A0A418WHB7_9PROT|nr:hypothetical protein D3874_21750 [Oleomonas cavernae]